jgi:uncharacterized protein (TIGR02302 family)
MHDFDDPQAQRLVKILKQKRALTAISMTLEQITLALWRPVTWALLICGLWLFHIPAMLGQAVAVFVACALPTGLLYFLYKDVGALRWPDEDAIDRRLENKSRLAHRPLTALKDSLANPEKVQTNTLWDKSRARLVQILPFLKAGKPEPFMARTDPYALRLGVLLFFGLGILTAGPAWTDRIINGLTPVTFNQKDSAAGVTLWVQPPDYTKQPQIVLQDQKKGEEPLKIPAGSILKIRVQGGHGKPTVEIAGQKHDMIYSGDDSYALETIARTSGSLNVKQFFLTRSKWNIAIVADTPPEITMSATPETLPSGALRFSFTFKDDYGVQNLNMKMQLDDTATKIPLGEPLDEKRSVMSVAGSEFHMRPVYDLSAHPWAGLPVVFTFSAEDAAGQKADAMPVKITLPERAFRHPLARALIVLRKNLALAPEDSYAQTARDLETLLAAPEIYSGDLVVLLALRSAASRLFYSKPSEQTARAVMALLWDTALRIEDGNLSLAARNLRDAQMNLEKALQNENISGEEVARLMHELREAMSDYFMEMHKEMQKNAGSDAPVLPPEAFSQMIDPDALANFLDKMEAEMREGNKGAAREMLSQLQRMMDMLDPSAAGPMPPDMQMMSEGISALQKLIERQNQLLEHTQAQTIIYQALQRAGKNYGAQLPQDQDLMERWGLQDAPPAPGDSEKKEAAPQINTQAGKAEQEALRHSLGQLMLDAAEALGDVPENFGLAERAMFASTGALGENRPDLSVEHQQKALDYLREAQKQLSQKLSARMQQMVGLMFGGGMRFDPLGRPYGGDNGTGPNMFPGSRVTIPDAQERTRALEVLRLLRRRAGELDRPDEELDYYHRLLRRF